MKPLITFALLTICWTTIAQTFSTKKGLTFYPGTYIDTEFRYTDSTGVDVIIQNSGPKWGTPLLDSARSKSGYSFLIFFNRIINQADVPLELTINFSADLLPVPRSSNAYLKVFLPPETMTTEKEAAVSYGLANLVSFLNTASDKPTTLQRTIGPKEACLFYVGVLFYQVKKGDPGINSQGSRTEFVLKEQNLYYKINQFDFELIPCGQIVVKK